MFHHTFIKFIVVGVINTIIGGVFAFLLYNTTKVGYWWSSAISYILTSILSFFLNKYFTFAVKSWSANMVLSFILTVTVSYLMAYGIAKPAMNYLLRDSLQRIRENMALFTGMCLFTGMNYLGQRLVVFKEKRKDSNEKTKY